MQYLIINRLGVFVTRVSPRHIREHLYSLIGQREAGLNLTSWDRGYQVLFRNQVADILEKDFVSCTRGIERMKQSLQVDVTMTQPSLVCIQILIMLADAVPYGLITSSVPSALGGIHMTDKTFSPKWSVSINATTSLMNLGCAFWEYKIYQCCNSVIEELDREQNDYHWTRTPFEQQLYEWAIAKRDTRSKTIMKVGSGVMHNTINIIGSSIDVAKEAKFANRRVGEKRKK